MLCNFCTSSECPFTIMYSKRTTHSRRFDQKFPMRTLPTVSENCCSYMFGWNRIFLAIFIVFTLKAGTTWLASFAPFFFFFLFWTKIYRRGKKSAKYFLSFVHFILQNRDLRESAVLFTSMQENLVFPA